MKRILSLALAALMLFALVGCSGDGEASASPSAAATPTPASSAPTSTPEDTGDGSIKYPLVEDGSVTFSWWLPMGGAAASIFTDLAENYSYSNIMKHTGVNIDFIHVSSTAATEQFSLMISSGSYPDIIDGFRYVGGPDKAIEDGVYMRLNELQDEFAPDYMALLNASPQNLRDATTDTGNRYAFHQITEGLQLQFCGLQIRRDWLDEMGYTGEPRTYDDLHDILTWFKDNKTGGSGPFILHETGLSLWNSFNGGFRVSSNNGNQTNYYIQIDGKAVNTIETENFREYLALCRDWYNEGLIYNDFFAFVTADSSVASIPDPKMLYDNLIGLVEVQSTTEYEANGLVQPGTVYEPIHHPVRNEGDVHTTGYNSNIVGNAGVIITTACSDPAMATRFFNFMYTDQGYIDSNFGEEGVTFNYNENGVPCLTELITANPDGLSSWNAQTAYIRGVGAMRYSWNRAPDPKRDAQRVITDERWGGVQHPGSIYPDPLPIQLTYTAEEGETRNAILADMQTYVAEMTVRFIIGSANLDTDWDEYVRQIKNIGSDTLRDIVQNALDRYYAR